MLAGLLAWSRYLQSRYAMRLIEQHQGGVGYLRKERVPGVGVLADALARGHEGECVADPTIVSRLLRRAPPARPLGLLTGREREVLALIAEGCSNKGICERLTLSAKTVEGHMRNIFMKPAAGESGGDHRRCSPCPATCGQHLSRRKSQGRHYRGSAPAGGRQRLFRKRAAGVVLILTQGLARKFGGDAAPWTGASVS